jgi:hypothetical protein
MRAGAARNGSETLLGDAQVGSLTGKWHFEILVQLFVRLSGPLNCGFKIIKDPRIMGLAYMVQVPEVAPPDFVPGAMVPQPAHACWINGGKPV